MFKNRTRDVISFARVEGYSRLAESAPRVADFAKLKAVDSLVRCVFPD